MIEILKTLILDFIEAPLETGVSRRIDIEPIPGKATVCVGVRRCGKSTYMFQVMQGLVNRGIPRENILYLNFFDDRLHDLQHEGLGTVIEAYYSLYPNKKNTEKVYYFFDEIQMISGWEPFVDRLQRTENCEIYITGSSANLLSKEIATQMRGRALSWEMFPFSFKEYLDYKGINITPTLSTKKRYLVRKAFEEYWQAGGFPEVAGLNQNLRIKIHQEYFQAILFRDLVERHDISHPKAVMDLAYRLIDTTASLYSINSLTGYLQSLSHKAPKSAVAAYVDWFEDAYFLFTVRVFDASLTRSKSAPKKIYCIDHAFVTSVSSGILLNSGHLLENLVFMALRRISPLVYYYKTKGGREVDFIIQTQDRTRTLVQVCESIANEQTRKREIVALNEAMTELGLNSSFIVTRNEEKQLKIEDKTINIVPIWRFLIDFPL
ncbi:MAG: ATP-binding protein [Alphaproteobacteria bacterium]|nr:ATP-binding protein [Alphaproteobacteria bacterium]